MKRFALLALLALTSSSGCADGTYYDDDDYEDDYDPAPVACFPSLEATVDSGAYIELDPGEGVGASVEYLGDGAWRVAVACDTHYSGSGCTWDLVLSSVDGSIDAFDPERLESDDELDWYPRSREDALRFLSYTDYDIDAVTLYTTPGAALRIDATLDGYCGGPYVLWVEEDEFVVSDSRVTDLYPFEP